jgi:hypothetical protein
LSHCQTTAEFRIRRSKALAPVMLPDPLGGRITHDGIFGRDNQTIRGGSWRFVAVLVIKVLNGAGVALGFESPLSHSIRTVSTRPFQKLSAAALRVDTYGA